MRADDFVLQLAREKGWLSDAQWEASQPRAGELRTDREAPGALAALLGEDGVLPPDRLAQLLAEEWGLPKIELTTAEIDETLRDLVPREVAGRFGMLPLARTVDGLRVAIADPRETRGTDWLADRWQIDVQPVIAPARDIAAAIARVYGDTEGPAAAAPIERLGAGEAESAAENLSVSDSDAQVVQQVHALIQEGVRRRASDIHLEPLAKRFRVRYRIDGAMIEAETLPKSRQLAVISRLKIMANISIAEKRVPQDGRIQLVSEGRRLDLRVSSLPTAHGESIVMRILDQASLKLGLAELGFRDEERARFERLITAADRIVLVTGPTGSGKTTTLYSCLHHLNQAHRKIITVEDPVEYQLTGINQVPVRSDVGMTFASALRAMLRQAPNVVMVGEIRDRETAEIAINASLTGHLVFSTLHTNDAVGAITRLIDIGVKPFLVATSLRATMAQRLVRKICMNCRQPHRPGAAELGLLNASPEQLASAQFARGAGCAACNGTGYRGRIGIFEVLELDEELQRMIYRHASAAQLRQRARALGLRTLREDGVDKVIAGLTTIEEVVSITAGDSS